MSDVEVVGMFIRDAIAGTSGICRGALTSTEARKFLQHEILTTPLNVLMVLLYNQRMHNMNKSATLFLNI